MTSLTLKARNIFCHDRFATDAAGVTIDRVEAGTAVCSMRLQPVHRNAMQAVMGGALFTLADLAFAAAANSRCLIADEPLAWVSIESSIHYLAQPKGELLHAEASCVRHGRSTCVYNILITDEQNCRIALVTTTGMHI